MAMVQSAPISITINAGSILRSLLLLTEGDSVITKTIKGSDLDKVGEVGLRPNPTHILSNSEGTLSAKFEKDDHFTNIKVTAEGTMFPIGTITSINMDDTDIDMDTTYFGVA